MDNSKVTIPSIDPKIKKIFTIIGAFILVLTFSIYFTNMATCKITMEI